MVIAPEGLPKSQSVVTGIIVNHPIRHRASLMDVSVIIPAYNRLWCLPRAIESCRNTNCTTEIIVVDDGSTDGTWEWLLQQPDLVIARQENQGQTYAVNKGTSLAKGDFIRFLDSDDFLEKGAIDRQYDEAIKVNAELICGRVDFYNEATKQVTVEPEVTGWKDFLEVQLSNRHGSHFLGMLFKRELIEQTPRRPDFAYREDRMFLLEIGLLQPKVALLAGCAGYWVQHAEQMQGNYSGLRSQVVNWQHLQAFKKTLAKLEAQDRLLPEYKKAACTALWPLAHWIAKSDINAATDIVKWINELDPDFEVPDKGMLGRAYKTIGFTLTEKLLRLRRALVK
jgi:glycosyltransferase involved in cell wall biosynthesis